MVTAHVSAAATFSVKKNLNASKPSNYSNVLDGDIGCRDKALHGTKRVPQCSHIIGSTILVFLSTAVYCNIGGKPTVLKHY